MYCSRAYYYCGDEKGAGGIAARKCTLYIHRKFGRIHHSVREQLLVSQCLYISSILVALLTSSAAPIHCLHFLPLPMPLNCPTSAESRDIGPGYRRHAGLRSPITVICTPPEPPRWYRPSLELCSPTTRQLYLQLILQARIHLRKAMTLRAGSFIKALDTHRTRGRLGGRGGMSSPMPSAQQPQSPENRNQERYADTEPCA